MGDFFLLGDMRDVCHLVYGVIVSYRPTRYVLVIFGFLFSVWIESCIKSEMLLPSIRLRIIIPRDWFLLSLWFAPSTVLRNLVWSCAAAASTSTFKLSWVCSVVYILFPRIGDTVRSRLCTVGCEGGYLISALLWSCSDLVGVTNSLLIVSSLPMVFMSRFVVALVWLIWFTFLIIYSLILLVQWFISIQV